MIRYKLHEIMLYDDEDIFTIRVISKYVGKLYYCNENNLKKNNIVNFVSIDKKDKSFRINIDVIVENNDSELLIIDHLIGTFKFIKTHIN